MIRTLIIYMYLTTFSLSLLGLKCRQLIFESNSGQKLRVMESCGEGHE